MIIPEAKVQDGRQIMDKSPEHRYPTKDIAKEDRKTHDDEEDEKDGRECEENSQGSGKTGASKGHNKYRYTTGGLTRP